VHRAAKPRLASIPVASCKQLARPKNMAGLPGGNLAGPRSIDPLFPRQGPDGCDKHMKQVIVLENKFVGKRRKRHRGLTFLMEQLR
jgi:hypothetical protein